MNDSRHSRRRPARPAFTLLELLVVISIIAILSLIALPSMVNMFRSNADAQAYNMLSAQLSAARAQAIRTSNYVLVHIQQVDRNNPPPGMQDRFFSAIMERDQTSQTGVFRSTMFGTTTDTQTATGSGFAPMMLPGSVAFGKVVAPYASTTNADQWNAASINDSDASNINSFPHFTTLSILFSPSGTVVPSMDGNSPTFDIADPLFDPNKPVTRIWDYNEAANNSACVSTVALFNWAEANVAADRANYMNFQSGAQYIAINAYTGQLFRRK